MRERDRQTDRQNVHVCRKPGQHGDGAREDHRKIN